MPLSRRSLLRAALSVGMGGAMTRLARAQAREGDGYSDVTAADEWMKKWMQGQKPGLDASTGALHVGRFADPIYFLLNEIEWKPGEGEAVSAVRAPTGFVTDFASIPRVFWVQLPPDGLYTFAAIIHDYLYWEQRGSRQDADLTFRYGMRDFKVPTPLVETIYSALRVGGEFAWRSNAALKAAGEKRVLKRFPTDPTTRWAEWKKKPGVF